MSDAEAAAWGGLLVLVCSCLGYQDRRCRAVDAAGCALKRQACRETWLARRPAGVRYAFFVGGEAPQGEPDVWGLDCPDTYHGLPEKVRAAFRRALLMPGWEFLFKCDDDSFCHLGRLCALVQERRGELCLTSWPGCARRFAHGGAGYLLPRRLVQAVVEDPLYGLEGVDHEDKQVTWSVRRAGFTTVGDARLRGDMSLTPSPENEVISCHHVGPEVMRGLVRLLFPAPLPPAWQRPQGRALLPPVRVAAGTMGPAAGAGRGRAAAHVWPAPLRLPRGTRRVVVLSNVTEGFSVGMIPLREGDFVLHCNHARHAEAAMAVERTRHVLFVRHGRGRDPRGWHWYHDGGFDGFERVVFIDDACLLAPFRWFREFRERTRKSPTTGFILANLARELFPEAPLLLAGFDPGQRHGTPLWRGHDWQAEADWYRERGFCLLRPRGCC